MWSLISGLCLSCSGDSCPQNGRSPGSVSTQHSSPRSDLNSGNFSNSGGCGSVPPNPEPNTALPQPPAASQASDVIIERKEMEGFGFVIISSLNRPETAAAAGLTARFTELFLTLFLTPSLSLSLSHSLFLSLFLSHFAHSLISSQSFPYPFPLLFTPSLFQHT